MGKEWIIRMQAGEAAARLDWFLWVLVFKKLARIIYYRCQHFN